MLRFERALSWMLIAVFALAACKSDPSSRDTGGRDTGEPPVMLDGGGRDARVEDGAGVVDARVEDAASPDVDAGSNEDATPADLGGEDAETPDTAQPDAAVPDAQVVQSGELIFTEYLAAEAAGAPEMIEVHNTTSADIDLTSYTLAITSQSAQLVIRAASDPSGTLAMPAIVAGSGYALGVLNPAAAGEIPGDVHFVFGTPGQYTGNAIADSGDRLLLEGPNGASDLLDFNNSAAGPAAAIGAGQFPLIAGKATVLDPDASEASANDDGGVWCTPLFGAATRGAINRRCSELIISEVLTDYASVPSDDDSGRELIELAGAAGAQLSGISVVSLAGTGTVAAEINLTGRVSRTGLFVLGSDLGNGTTLVDGADQVAAFALSNGSGGVQVVRGNGLLDAFGWGSLAPGLVDVQRGLPVYEGTPELALAVVDFPAAYARAPQEQDSGDNRSDFHYDPSPTAGALNEFSQLNVLDLSPDDAAAGSGTTFVLLAFELTDYTSVTIGNESAACTALDFEALSCTVAYPAAGSGMAERVEVEVETRSEHGEGVLLPAAFTWTTALNETDLPAECDFCNLQFPAAITVAAGTATPLIYGQIYEGGLTDVTMGGPAPGITAELGYGPVGTDARTSNAWVWVESTFNGERGPSNNNDEFQASLTIDVPGMYYYTYRYSFDGGLTFSYGDTSGAGSNSGQGFNPIRMGELTVQ